MIGVAPCSDSSVTDECNNADASVLGRSHLPHNQSAAAGFGGDTSVATLNSSLGGARLNSSIRPLTQAYKAAGNDGEVSEADGSLCCTMQGGVFFFLLHTFSFFLLSRSLPKTALRTETQASWERQWNIFSAGKRRQRERLFHAKTQSSRPTSRHSPNISNSRFLIFGIPGIYIPSETQPRDGMW